MNFRPLDEFLESLLDMGFPMYDTTIHVAGREVYRRRGGYIDAEKKRRHEDGTLYCIYSCSKPVTCAAALTLLERGKLLLSDPVYAYLPEFRDVTVAEKREDGTTEIRPAKTVMRLQHLFTMTSGLNYNLRSPSVTAVLEADPHAGTREIVRAFAREPLSFDPGERWQYSLSHDVLAAVVEVVSGKRFGEYVRETIFEPLGMKDSDYCTGHVLNDPAKLSRLAQQYRFRQDFSGVDVVGPQCGYAVTDEYESGGAGIVTTAEDYIRFADMMAMDGVGADGTRVLSPYVLSLMRTNAITAEQARSFVWSQYRGYGYGLGVRTLVDPVAASALTSAGEYGWCGAAGAITIFDPARKLAVYHAQHTLNPREEYVFPRLRNLAASCTED